MKLAQRFGNDSGSQGHNCNHFSSHTFFALNEVGKSAHRNRVFLPANADIFAETWSPGRSISGFGKRKGEKNVAMNK